MHQGEHTISLYPEDEQAITGELYKVTDCKYPLTSYDATELVARYSQNQDEIIAE